MQEELVAKLDWSDVLEIWHQAEMVHDKSLEEIIASEDLSTKVRPMINLNWVNEYCEDNVLGKPSRENMQKLILGLNELAQNGLYSDIDSIFYKIASESSSKYTLVTLLRTTSPFRSFLKKWDQLRDNAIEWLSKKDIDPNKVLTGLL